MNTTRLITLGALIGTCNFAAAQDAPPAAPTPKIRPQREVPADVLKKYDKDGDGKLSPDEVKAMRDARKAETLKKYDKDGDGKLSDEERQAMKDDIETRRKALLEKYDANKNGKLDPDEMKAAREAGEEIPPAGRGPGGKRGGGKDGPKPADGGPQGE